jgi:hypothetical protein
MSTLSTRDRWLAATVPALVILLIGWIYYLRPAGRETALLKRQVEGQGPLEDQLDRVALARSGLEELEKTVAKLRTVRPPATAVFNRNLAMQQISKLCQTHTLSLVGTNPEASDGRLSPALKSAALALTQHGTTTPPEVWRIDLTGSYSNVVKMLEGLKNAEALIIPLSISMKADPRERKSTCWTMTLWL